MDNTEKWKATGLLDDFPKDKDHLAYLLEYTSSEFLMEDTSINIEIFLPIIRKIYCKRYINHNDIKTILEKYNNIMFKFKELFVYDTLSDEEFTMLFLNRYFELNDNGKI